MSMKIVVNNFVVAALVKAWVDFRAATSAATVALSAVLMMSACGCNRAPVDPAPAPDRPSLQTWDYSSFTLLSDGDLGTNYLQVMVETTNQTHAWNETNWVSSASDVMRIIGKYGWDLVCYDPVSKEYIVKRPTSADGEGDFIVGTEWKKN